MRLSYSSLETFENCPAKFKFQVIDRIKTPKSKEAVLGTLVHDALKMFHQPSRVVSPTEEELLQYFNQAWDASFFENQTEEMLYFHQGIKMLKDYYAKNRPADFNIVDLETSFEVGLGDGTEIHLITGKIDRIDKLLDGRLEIIDYKTTKKMPSQKLVDDNTQLAIYHLGVVNRWPSFKDKPIKLSLYYLKHGEKLSVVKGSENLERTKDKLIESIGKISKCVSENKFDPRPSPLCDWCGYQSTCPLFKHKYRLADQPTVDEQKVKTLIDEYLELKIKSDEMEDKMSEIKNAINAYCDKENAERVFGENGYITRSLQQRFSYDYEQLRQILEPLGKWNDVLDVDSVKLKRAIKELPADVARKVEEAKRLAKEYKVLSVKFNSKKK